MCGHQTVVDALELRVFLFGALIDILFTIEIGWPLVDDKLMSKVQSVSVVVKKPATRKRYP